MLLREFARIPEGTGNGKSKRVLVLRCDVCGIEFERDFNVAVHRRRLEHYCSHGCFNQSFGAGGLADSKRRATNRKKYGVDYGFNHPDVARDLGRRAHKPGAKAKRAVTMKRIKQKTSWQLKRGLTLQRSKSEIEFLEALSVELGEYVPQKYINGWWVDGYFPAHELWVFFDGVYWHSKPGIPERDAAQDAWFQLQGLKHIRVTDREWRADSAGCIARIIVSQR